MREGIAFVLLALTLGCAAKGEPKSPANAASQAEGTSPDNKPLLTALVCPKPDQKSVFDVAALFGVDAQTSARVERVLQMTKELQASTASLERDTRSACADVTRDLGGSVTPTKHPCEAAMEELGRWRKRLSSGTRLLVQVRGVACGVDRASLERCAGECLTGLPNVDSSVECGVDLAPRCTGTLGFPNAGSACATQCGVRALRSFSCSAEVDVRFEGAGDTMPNLDGLRKDLPRVVSIATGIAPRVERLGKDIAGVIDELASTIDQLTSHKPKTEKLVIAGATLATCVAPELGNTLRAAKTLQAEVGHAVSLHRAFTID